jgi:hypothetical protein
MLDFEKYHVDGPVILLVTTKTSRILRIFIFIYRFEEDKR